MEQNAIYYTQLQEYTICPACGNTAIVDPEILTSLPPQRRIRCKCCDYVGYKYCHELKTFGNEINHQNSLNNIMLQTKLSTDCFICGESTEFVGGIVTPYICPKCKKAILKVREFLEHNEN